MKTILKDILGLFLYLAIILLCTYLVVHFVVQRTAIEGNSMNPLLKNQDQVLVDKITYRFKEPQRYDVIVFPYRYERDVFFVKRIIGLPGEKVQINAQGEILINDERLDDPYTVEAIDHAGVASTPRILKENEYFVLGDNRNHSHDSRDTDIGVIRRDEIIGTVSLRIYPFKKIKKANAQGEEIDGTKDNP